MPLVGVVCDYDSTFQKFEYCIQCHEQRDCKRICDAPVYLLKLMRDNDDTRRDAGISASVLTSCPRAYALQQTNDYYEAVQSGWNKARGTWLHAMIESDAQPKEGVIRERRLVKRYVVDGGVVPITGKSDEIDPQLQRLVDYKSCDLLPRRASVHHEAQFNIYVDLLDGGVFMDTGEISDIQITNGGMHYITWRKENPFLFMEYPVWSKKEREAFIIRRATPLVKWLQTDELPVCSPLFQFPGAWRCDCVKLEEQIEELKDA